MLSFTESCLEWWKATPISAFFVSALLLISLLIVDHERGLSEWMFEKVLHVVHFLGAVTSA